MNAQTKLARARLLLDAYDQGYTEIADGQDFVMITAASVMHARMVVLECNKEKSKC